MNAALMHAACAAAAFSGWLVWALSVERHREDAALAAASRWSPRRQRALATGLLLASLAFAFAHEGPSFGALTAVSWLGVAGFAVVLLLAWWPQHAALAMRLGMAACALAALASRIAPH